MSTSLQAQLPLLRTSERAAFQRCPQAWYWSYVEGLTPIAEKKIAADFGSITHLALAEYYPPGTKRGPHPAETWLTAAQGQVAKIKTDGIVGEETIEQWIDFLVLGPALMEAYVDYYGGDPHWDVLDAERRFAINIPDVRYPAKIDPENGKRGYTPICTLVGTFDLCVRDLNDNQVKMTDHKTAQSLYTNHLTLDPQPSTYIAVATSALRHQGLIGPKEVVKGMEWNIIRKGKPDERPTNAEGQALNKDGTVSLRQPTPLFKRFWVPRSGKERERQIVRISEEQQVMQLIAQGKIPVWKDYSRECSFCKFFDLCELDETGQDVSYFKESVFKKHDPYFDHRPEAINSKKVTAI